MSHPHAASESNIPSVSFIILMYFGCALRCWVVGRGVEVGSIIYTSHNLETKKTKSDETIKNTKKLRNYITCMKRRKGALRKATCRACAHFFITIQWCMIILIMFCAPLKAARWKFILCSLRIRRPCLRQGSYESVSELRTKNLELRNKETYKRK